METPAAGAASQTPVDAQIKENPRVQELIQQYQEVQRKYEEQIRINGQQRLRLWEQDKMILQKQDLKIKHDKLYRMLDQVKIHEGNKLFQDSQREFIEKENLYKLDTELLRQKRMINYYVGDLVQENKYLKEFSSEQMTIAHSKQAKVEEMKYTIQILQRHVEKLEEEKRALNICLQGTMEKAKSTEILLATTTNNLQRVQKEKQDFSRQQMASILNKQKVEEMKYTIQTLQMHVEILNNNRSAFEQTIKQQEITLDERRKTIETLEEEERALDIRLQNTMEKAKSSEILLATTTNNLQRVQEEKQEINRQQMDTILNNQAKVEEMEKTIENLHKLVAILTEDSQSKHDSLIEPLHLANRTIKEQEITLENMTRSMEKYKEQNMALNVQLQEALEKAEGREILLTSTTNKLQNEQEEKQALQNKLSTLKGSLTIQKKMVSEAQNNAQELEKNLEAERSNVQALTTDLDTQKTAFEALSEKCHTTIESLEKENKTHKGKIEALMDKKTRKKRRWWKSWRKGT